MRQEFWKQLSDGGKSLVMLGLGFVCHDSIGKGQSRDKTAAKKAMKMSLRRRFQEDISFSPQHVLVLISSSELRDLFRRQDSCHVECFEINGL